MKKQNPYWKMSLCLATAALAWLGSLTTGQAAVNTNAAQNSISAVIRPLTPTEIKVYNLTNYNYGWTNAAAQVSGGLSTVALGEPVYVDVMGPFGAFSSNSVVGIGWTLTVKDGSGTPISTAATVSSSGLTAGPLTASVPLYKTSDKWSGYAGWPSGSTPNYDGPTSTNLVLVGRAYFRPDVVGFYTLTGTVTNQYGAMSSTTNVVVNITGATYLGITACAGCHGSSPMPGAPVVYPTFTNTLHASFMTRAIDGLVSSHYSKSCITCHLLGQDALAVNNGFDDVAAQLNWTFPSVLTNGNWAAMPSQLQNLANIQCEHCHGPGSQHIYSQGLVGNTNAITVSYADGVCSQCHDSLNTHFRPGEWNNSLHAASAHQNGSTCNRCHTGPGFIQWCNAGGMATQVQYPTNVLHKTAYSTNFLDYSGASVGYESINCQACHDPHDASNPHQLRMGYTVSLMDGTVITNAGSGAICIQCHQNSRFGSYTNMLMGYATYNGTVQNDVLYTPSGSIAISVTNQVSRMTGPGAAGRLGTHDSPQADLFFGQNAETYGKQIASGPHFNVVSNTCAGCHMQVVAAGDPAFTKAGGHTFKMSYTNSVGAKVALSAVCAQCHGTITNFDMLVPDYAGVGQPMGIQSQVKYLLNKLSTYFPAKVYRANPTQYVADGVIKYPDSALPQYTNMPLKYLKAYYNYCVVYYDNSWGVHNAKFAVGLLKASIADLSGDANNDGLPDAWQTSVYGAGYYTNAAAAYNYVTNGLPNWMWANLNLNPSAGFSVAGNSGSIYINNGSVANGQTNAVQIYTAAEIAFNTQVGTTYTIQGVSALTGGWQTISTNIPGTGSAISYLVKTRGTNQMFYRVGHNP